MAANAKTGKPGKPGKESQPLIIAKTPAEEQRLKLERLMRNPVRFHCMIVTQSIVCLNCELVSIIDVSNLPFQCISYLAL